MAHITPEQVAALVRKMLRAGFAFESIEDVTAAAHAAPGAFCTAAAAINREHAAGYIAAEVADRRGGDTTWATVGTDCDHTAIYIFEVSADWEQEYPGRARDLLAL